MTYTTQPKIWSKITKIKYSSTPNQLMNNKIRLHEVAQMNSINEKANRFNWKETYMKNIYF